MGTLADFIGNASPAASADLHLVHCTTVSSGLGAISAGKIEPKYCKEYLRDILYLFYGRPAYKPGHGVGASNIIDLAPVCLVIDPKFITSASRILPFDSGGYGRYANLVGPHLERSAFEIGSSPTAARNLVEKFFSSNRNYYDQNPTLSERDISPIELTARAYARLISDPNIRDLDDRCSTIEIQVEQSISLADALRAIVAPSIILDSDEIKKALIQCGAAVPLPYRTYGRFDPVSFANTIYEKVDDFLQSEGAF